MWTYIQNGDHHHTVFTYIIMVRRLVLQKVLEDTCPTDRFRFGLGTTFKIISIIKRTCSAAYASIALLKLIHINYQGKKSI